MAVQLHPIEQIVNVKWDEDLAVEFFDKDGPPIENETA
jgi:hypothetical protein